ncbi:hypothetical protein KHC28_22885 [Ancylobacter sonchi]|uniref:hypothetical protein n=1 Tax=Ancylobacter sonchi TaxID=1937790 RepID=UPI001BD30660|nr:hypothetical protein [Ancylobacter sonchi]MBS7536505.1 hypothetical protein [Ancylobacter sonchi]
MTIDANSIAADIFAGVAEKSPGDAQPLGGANPATEFCKIWPKAKPILEFIAGLITFIPGGGPIAAGVLTGLIKVGDQVSAQLCP